MYNGLSFRPEKDSQSSIKNENNWKQQKALEKVKVSNTVGFITSSYVLNRVGVVTRTSRGSRRGERPTRPNYRKLHFHSPLPPTLRLYWKFTCKLLNNMITQTFSTLLYDYSFLLNFMLIYRFFNFYVFFLKTSVA